MSILNVKQHDTSPDFRATLTDAGTPVNLTTATSIKVVGARDGVVVFSRAATGSSVGVVTMPFQAADTADPGRILVEVEVTWPGGGVQTFPPDTYLAVDVTADLG